MISPIKYRAQDTIPDNPKPQVSSIENKIHHNLICTHVTKDNPTQAN
jgi:hypothetical protein